MRRGIRRIPFLLVLIAAVLYATLAVQAAEGTLSVQILGINDFHGALLPSGQVDNRPAGGAAILAAWMKERAQANPNTLVVSAGDAIGASQPISGLLQDEPTIEFLNALGCDVAAAGNHEFDEGGRNVVAHEGGKQKQGYRKNRRLDRQDRSRRG